MYISIYIYMCVCVCVIFGPKHNQRRFPVLFDGSDWPQAFAELVDHAHARCSDESRDS